MSSIAEQTEQMLREVMDPELGSDIVELGMYKGAELTDDGILHVKVALTTLGCPLRAQIQGDIKTRLGSLDGVKDIKLDFIELNQDEKANALSIARKRISENPVETEVPANTRVLLVASGKGGVGKSSISVSLALALAQRGLTVGLLDADIWGFSVPRMLGLSGRLEGSLDEKKILPQTRDVEVVGAAKNPDSATDSATSEKAAKKTKSGQLKVVSMGLLVESEETALMWRGLILNRAVQHFCQDVLWGDLDYLLVDMPPGTGDVQMGIAKLLPRSEMIVVTTPDTGAQKVAARAVSMGRKNYLRIVGVIENMTALEMPDGSRHEIFGSGGGEALSKEAGIPLLGQIPIDPALSALSLAPGQIQNQAEERTDNSPDLLSGNPDSPAQKAINKIAERIVTRAAPPIKEDEMLLGCSAHDSTEGVQVSLGKSRTK